MFFQWIGPGSQFTNWIPRNFGPIPILKWKRENIWLDAYENSLFQRLGQDNFAFITCFHSPWIFTCDASVIDLFPN